MGTRLIAGLVGLVIAVILLQSFVFGGDDTPGIQGRTGFVPTATPPAQLPEPIVLGESTGRASAGAGAAATTTSTNTYTVKSNDTLQGIAAEMNVPPEQRATWITEVLRLNSLADARSLQAGQELRLPAAPGGAATPGQAAAAPSATRTGGPATSPTQAPAVQATATPARTSGSGGTYTVVSGDTAYGIAEKHCVDSPAAWVNELLILNDLESGSLRPGQELDLPAGTPPVCDD